MVERDRAGSNGYEDAAAQPILAAAAAFDEPETVPAPRAALHVEAASVDVVVPDADAALPGAHRGGFTRAPTAPIDIAEEVHEEFVPTTSPVTVDEEPVSTSFAVLALGFAVVGLVVAIVVGWGFPIGITAVVLGILSLRRGVESRALAAWGIALGAASLVYSAGWLLWAAYAASALGSR